MNKHIELVKKWLDDPDSVTKEKIKANANAAADAADAAWAVANDAAAYTAYAAADDAANAAAWVVADDAEAAARFVKRYEELTEQKDNE